MPTLQDLSELLTERADDAAPDRHAVIARVDDALGSKRSPVRRATPWLAAAAVVALAAGVVALAGSSNRRGEPAPPGAVPPQGHVAWQFAIGKIPGWTARTHLLVVVVEQHRHGRRVGPGCRSHADVRTRARDLRPRAGSRDLSGEFQHCAPDHRCRSARTVDAWPPRQHRRPGGARPEAPVGSGSSQR